MSEPADVRVLYVIDSLAQGGAERSLAEVAPHVVAQGVDLHVAVLHDRPGYTGLFEEAGIPVWRVVRRTRPGWIVGLARLTRSLRPDLVHTTLFESDVCGRPAAWVCGTPVTTSLVNSPPTTPPPGLKARLAEGLDRATARLAVRFHANARHVAESTGRRLGIPPERIVVIPRGRDASLLGTRQPARRAAAREALGCADGDSLLLAVARHEHQKGLDLLLRALPTVRAIRPRARLVVAGRRGRESGRLERLVARLNLEGAVAFVGARDDVPELLCAADVFVLSSRYEGLPGALIEALALEAPAVATRQPGVAEVLGEHSAATLVAPEDPGALAAGISSVLDDPEAARARAERGRRRFLEHFTIERVAEATAAFYREAEAAGGAARRSATRPP